MPFALEDISKVPLCCIKLKKLAFSIKYKTAQATNIIFSDACQSRLGSLANLERRGLVTSPKARTALGGLGGKEADPIAVLGEICDGGDGRGSLSADVVPAGLGRELHVTGRESHIRHLRNDIV